ncbi:MAG TPA: aminomethyl-transferring glycine dehydrogenase subunit GcvPB [Candidatus Krumholzibacteria bacterium]|nr:aminomethyl-transferring glycine dehydrogenase subunit GcvPB [Candidatus Krumholzibacteria bacterium]HRX50339.1 aminomethyl-transferring glycine dehydrogenase subunit GcvPB [Candidatus Krumholzibacteria bacterium]
MSRDIEPIRWGASLQPSLFELGRPGRRAVDMPRWDDDEPDTALPAEYLRAAPADLPSLSEPQVLRHYTRLSNLNHHIERGMYPLGSCTMKYNPRLNEKVAALPGFADLHPDQHVDDIQGLLCALKILEDSLCRITGFAACSLVPSAGAQGELMGMACIRAFHVANGQPERVEVLIPDSAHGTNPASVVLAGMTPRTIASRADGRLDVDAVRAAVGPATAGIMITNPNTLGLFETEIREVAAVVHAAGGRLYMDGANMNAILGRAQPALMGFDVVHLNLHKTFSTPHGGGGPGAGPICVTAELEPFLPGARIVEEDEVYDLVHRDGAPAIHTHLGNVGVQLRALAYILRLGEEGLRRVSDLAVLNANYLLKRLTSEGVLQVDHAQGCLHEFIASGRDWKKEFGVRTLDVAKRLLDYGVHAPTIYFPLIVEEAMMIEPTETESKETLDHFVEILKAIRAEAAADPDVLHNAPENTPIGRLDEARAARQPDLSWMGPCNC